MASVTYENATRVFDKVERPAVSGLDLQIADGELMVLVGPSGCGKSTSLRMLAGLEPVDEGAVYIGEQNVTTLPPKARDVAMVFQSYALYPHMTVADNMGFALKIAGRPKAEIRARVAEAARILELEPYLERKPRALSGGQRQRVAMGRAIVRQPQAFLMDEPLSNLDAKLRVQTRTEIASLQRRLGVTTVYVTHDQVEAMTMGDRVAVLDHGVLQQVDTPGALYAQPANVFVAGFIGSPAMNVQEAPLGDDGADLPGYPVPLPREVVSAAQRDGSGRVVLGFRPESVDVVADGADGLAVTVALVEVLGADAYLHTRLNGGEAAGVVARIDAKSAPSMGQGIRLAIRPGELHVFSASTGRRLG